ncbi:MAG: YwmB family TATA-box binding protein [Bacillus sp. (in: firmicutes)]
MYKFIYLLIIGLIIASVGNITIVADSGHIELKRMQRVLELDSSAIIEEWSVIAREKTRSITNEQQFTQELNELKTNLPDFKWDVKKDSTKLTATGTNAGTSFRESVSLASTLNGGRDSYITYEMKGNASRDGWAEQASEMLNRRVNMVLNENATFFTCIKGHFNDTIDKVLTVKTTEWLKRFQAKEVESLQEKQLVSITAQSELFNQSNANEHYNFQLAMRTDGMGARTSFVIGTPIITFEY